MRDQVRLTVALDLLIEYLLEQATNIDTALTACQFDHQRSAGCERGLCGTAHCPGIAGNVAAHLLAGTE